MLNSLITTIQLSINNKITSAQFYKQDNVSDPDRKKAIQEADAAYNKVLADLEILIGYAKWFSLMILIISLIAAGVQFTKSRQEDNEFQASNIIKILFAAITISSASSIVTFLLF